MLQIIMEGRNMSTSNRGLAIGPARLRIAVHALVWLTQSEEKLSSTTIASQVNSHATFLRRVMQSLTQAGLVEAKEGRDGGYALGKAAHLITLADVYLAVKTGCKEVEQDIDCNGEVCKQLDQVLESIMTDAELQTIQHLRQITIEDVVAQIDFFVDVTNV